MQDFNVSKRKAALMVLVLLVGVSLTIETSWAQKATTGDGGDMTVPKSVTAPTTKGVVQVQVPNLIGKTEEVAKKELSKVGLKAGKVLFTTLGKGKPNTVVKQKPTTKTKVTKGSTVDLWILQEKAVSKAKIPKKKPSTVSPKIVQKGKKVYMEFPETVRNVTISDAQGKKLQQFKQGKRFDVTESVVATNAGLVDVEWEFSPPDKLYWLPFQTDILFDRFNLTFIEGMLIAMADQTTIENGEPANDFLNGATSVSTGPYAGVVGGDDPWDYLRITAGSGGFGTYFSVRVLRGEVSLTLYDPQQQMIAGQWVDNLWITLKPGTTFYVAVRSNTSASKEYTITIASRVINDTAEPNNTQAQAQDIHNQTRVLCNVMNSAAQHVGINDWYKINLQQAQKMEIIVNNAGLHSSDTVYIYLYEPNGSGPIAESDWFYSTNEYARLEVDLRDMYYPGYPDPNYPFPAGQWKILVTNSTTGQGGQPHPFGVGDAPACYFRSSGYSLVGGKLP